MKPWMCKSANGGLIDFIKLWEPLRGIPVEALVVSGKDEGCFVCKRSIRRDRYRVILYYVEVEELNVHR